MIIVGIHGAIEHGKSTFAEQLCSLEPNSAHFESSTVIAEVLDELHWELTEPFQQDTYRFVNEWMHKLPPILKDIVKVDTSPEKLEFSEDELRDNPRRFEKLFEHAVALQNQPWLSREVINPENKPLYRAGLQGLGGYLVTKVSPTIWYDELLRRVAKKQQSGTELSVIGGLRYPADAEVIRAAGGKIIEVFRPDMPVRDLEDPTEKFRKQIVSDATVRNNGTISQLRRLAVPVLDDLRDNALDTEYIANPT